MSRSRANCELFLTAGWLRVKQRERQWLPPGIAILTKASCAKAGDSWMIHLCAVLGQDGRSGSDLEDSMIASRSLTSLGYVLGAAVAAAMIACLGALLIVFAHDRTPAGSLLVVEEIARPGVGMPPHSIRLSALLTRLPESGPITATSRGCNRIMVWRLEQQDVTPTLVLDRIAMHCLGQARVALTVQRDRSEAAFHTPVSSPVAASKPARALPIMPSLRTIVDRHVPGRAAAPTYPF